MDLVKVVVAAEEDQGNFIVIKKEISKSHCREAFINPELYFGLIDVVVVYLEAYNLFETAFGVY